MHAWRNPADGVPNGLPKAKTAVWRVSEWLAATLEMSCPERGCGFESHALRSDFAKKNAKRPASHRDVRAGFLAASLGLVGGR